MLGLLCNTILLSSKPHKATSLNCVYCFLALWIGWLVTTIISPHSLCFPLPVCVCACVAEKGSSHLNSGRRLTGGAQETKSITSFWKKVHFLLNMKGRVLPMLLFMPTKSMFLFPVKNSLINQPIRTVKLLSKLALIRLDFLSIIFVLL